MFKNMLSLTLVLIIIAALCSCNDGYNIVRDLSSYERDGYYTVLGNDTKLLEYRDIPIMDLVLSTSGYEAEFVTFDKVIEGKFTKTDSKSYVGQSGSEYDMPRLSKTGADGKNVYPEQFARYTVGDKVYYAVGSLTKCEGYSTSANGKKLLFLASDGTIVMYDDDAKTLTGIGTTEYNGKKSSEFGKSWVIKAAIDPTGRFIAFTSNRRTFDNKGASVTDLWIYDLSKNSEDILLENVTTYGDLFFDGNQIFYCNINGEDMKYSYIGTDITTKKQTAIDWDSSYTNYVDGKIVGQRKMYDIASGTTFDVDSSVNDVTTRGVLSEDGKSVVSLSDKDEQMLLNVVEIEGNKSTKFLLPHDFKMNFVSFSVVGKRDNAVVLFCSFVNDDNSGAYSAYYTIDIGFVNEK